MGDFMLSYYCIMNGLTNIPKDEAQNQYIEDVAAKLVYSSFKKLFFKNPYPLFLNFSRYIVPNSSPFPVVVFLLLPLLCQQSHFLDLHK